MINLISDTATKPTNAMLSYMMQCPVGDDVFRSDPTVNSLQEEVASMFGMEDALYCPSGTMTNQIAIQCHIQPLEEMICDASSHVYQYETGGYAYNARASVQLIEGINGKISAHQVEAAIRPRYDWLPVSRLVVLENTTNKGGGNYYTIEEIDAIRDVCKKNNLILHMDGARFFNAIVETGESPLAYGKRFDTISICLSKGLGAPVGSVLLGNKGCIAKARRIRKVMGGGMRQSGFMAGAGLFALKNHIDRLKKDNDRAKELGQLLASLSWVASVRPVRTNIIILDLAENILAENVLKVLEKHHVLASAFGKQTLRFVTHLDYTEEMHIKLLKLLSQLQIA